MRSASASTKLKSAVVMVISHGQRTAYCIAAGYSAQSHADHSATRRSKQRAAICQMATAVAAENADCMVNSTHADAAV